MRRKNKSIYIVLIVVALIGITIGYAAISRTLNITGNSEVKQNTWDLHFENIKITNGSVEADDPTIDNTNLVVNFNFFLNLPGDFYEFTVEVHNDGSIDAMIDSITKTPILTAAQQKYMNYIIEYQNGEQIAFKQLVKSNEFVRFKVRVEYRSDVQEADMPTTNETLNLGFAVNYVQADSTGISVTDNGMWIAKANGLLENIGTIVTIGIEKFYTIGTEGDNVKLLSMHNLYVGGVYDYSLRTYTMYGEEATGMQDENMGMYVEGQDKEGATPFASQSQMGTNPSDYNGSIVEGYVNNYKTKLEENFYVEVIEARLITYDELTNSETFNCNTKCSTNYPWLYSTAYWTGSARNPGQVIYVHSDGYTGATDFRAQDGAVRPVIVMSKSDIKLEIKPVANGSLDDIGTIVTIGSEQFYTIGTEGENVKLLSMYNLYVGNSVHGDNNVIPLENPTGKQSEVAKGWVDGALELYGTTAFSSSTQHGTNYNDYNGSIVEGYVNAYKDILESEEYGVPVVEARLITKDELESEDIGCDSYNRTCNDAPSWIYSTTYWTGSDDGAGSVWYVISSGGFSDSYYLSDNGFGVRPVIIISKSLF